MSTAPVLEAKEAPPLEKQTTVGNYFVSNYPPFSFWKPEFVGNCTPRWSVPRARARNPLGIYLHIPFCRKRCHFCYFRVYTDKDSAAIKGYIDATLQEFAIYAAKPAHSAGANRTSFISAAARRRIFPWTSSGI